jgi:hypothetical protein
MNTVMTGFDLVQGSRKGIEVLVPRVTRVSSGSCEFWNAVPDSWQNKSFEGMDEHLKPLFAALNKGGLTPKKRQSICRRILGLL